MTAHRPAQQEFAALAVHELDLRAAQILRGRDERQTGDFGRQYRVGELGFAEDQLVAGQPPLVALDAEPGAGIALRVEVDDQCAMPGGGQCRRQVDRGRGFADAALLVGDREDARAMGDRRRLRASLNTREAHEQPCASAERPPADRRRSDASTRSLSSLCARGSIPALPARLSETGTRSRGR